MSINKSNLFWGVLLIGGGVLALVQQLGYIHAMTEQVWMWIFVAISLLALVSYALSGWKQWAWLFPAGLFGGLAVTIALDQTHIHNSAIGSPLFFGLLIPFVAAYLTDRARNWWALIPGAVILFLGLTTLVAGLAPGEWIGSLFLLMLGLSFLVVYLNNRTRSWALLVAYILGVLSIAPAMAAGDHASYYGSIFLLAVALPFFILYFRSPDKWWAILPAGVLTVLALVAMLGVAGLIRSQNEGGVAATVLFAGLAATFAIVWLRSARRWAQPVTIILAALAVASLFFANYYQIVWPVVIILGGIYLLYSALRPKTA